VSTIEAANAAVCAIEVNTLAEIPLQYSPLQELQCRWPILIISRIEIIIFIAPFGLGSDCRRHMMMHMIHPPRHMIHPAITSLTCQRGGFEREEGEEE
jgi:hypothetical protein